MRLTHPLKLSSNMEPTPPAPSRENTSPSLHTCDCGKEFLDFNLMVEHRNLHSSEPQLLHLLGSNMSPFIGEAGVLETLIQQESLKSAVSQPNLFLSYYSTSLSPAYTGIMPPVSGITSQDQVTVTKNKGVSIWSSSQDSSKSCGDLTEEEPQNIFATQEQRMRAKLDLPPQDKTASVLSKGTSHGESLPRDDSTKSLARADKPCSNSPQTWVPIETEAAPPAEIKPANKQEMSPGANPFVEKLRQLLKKSSRKTESPAAGLALDPNEKSAESLIKILSPVVLLKTTSELVDPGSDTDKQKGYQCVHCLKVSPDLSSLMRHHFIHKREGVKRCRHCKEVIIHLPICPQSVSGATQPPSSSQGEVPIVQRTRTSHDLNEKNCLRDPRDDVFCQLCKHGYSHIYDLKRHRGQGPGSSLPLRDSSSTQKAAQLKSNRRGVVDAKVPARPLISKSITVCTETGSIRVDVPATNPEQSEKPRSALWGSAKSFAPFNPKTPPPKQAVDGSTRRKSLREKEGRRCNLATVTHEGSDREQSKTPLDGKTEGPGVPEDADTKAEVKLEVAAECAKSAENTSWPTVVRNGVRRLCCNRCKRSFIRPGKLRAHLKQCRRKSDRLGPASQNKGRDGVLETTQPPTHKSKPSFNCFVCGKSFTRKYKMSAHVEKCMSKRTTSGTDSVASQPDLPGSGSEGHVQQDNGGDWSIMLDGKTEGPGVPEDADTKTEVKLAVAAECAKSAENTSWPTVVRNGVRRLCCNRCKRSFIRPEKLRAHLKQCRLKSDRLGPASQNEGRDGVLETTQPPTHKSKPSFNCFVCGKSFTRKYRMSAHVKKCMSKRTTSGTDSVASQPDLPGSGSEGHVQQGDGGDWSIMSLPSVLHWRVTCDCGAGFTSPRLLLEHLQKHSQESYTCPTCGQTVSTWVGYKAHLEGHMHPRHLVYKGLQPQCSQSLVLHFKQQPSPQQPVPPQR